MIRLRVIIYLFVSFYVYVLCYKGCKGAKILKLYEWELEGKHIWTFNVTCCYNHNPKPQTNLPFVNNFSITEIKATGEHFNCRIFSGTLTLHNDTFMSYSAGGNLTVDVICDCPSYTSDSSCRNPIPCLNEGIRSDTVYDLCICPAYWFGSQCENHCVRGNLTSFNNCSCENGYEGDQCDKKAQKLIVDPEICDFICLFSITLAITAVVAICICTPCLLSPTKRNSSQSGEEPNDYVQNPNLYYPSLTAIPAGSNSTTVIVRPALNTIIDAFVKLPNYEEVMRSPPSYNVAVRLQIDRD